MSSKRNDDIQRLFDYANNKHNFAIRLCGKVEQEISTLNSDEKIIFLKDIFNALYI